MRLDFEIEKIFGENIFYNEMDKDGKRIKILEVARCRGNLYLAKCRYIDIKEEDFYLYTMYLIRGTHAKSKP